MGQAQVSFDDRHKHKDGYGDPALHLDAVGRDIGDVQFVKESRIAAFGISKLNALK
jgi:hypothetical protein